MLVYCGESGENTDEWVATFQSLLDSNKICWHYWPYKKLDNPRCFVTIKKPVDYDLVIAYTEKQRQAFSDIRKNAPTEEEREKIKQAIFALLDDCRFEYCIANKGYIEALGLFQEK